MKKRSVMMELRYTAKQQLLAYRKNRANISAHVLRGEEREAACRWAAAIEAARELLKCEMPEKERAMSRLFGLDTPIPKYQQTQGRVVRLCAELHVAEATLYKWREDIILLVLGAAIEAGAIRPFRIGE